MKIRKYLFRWALLATALAVGGGGYAKADTVTDTTTGVAYTLTSTFVPEEGNNTYDVTLTVNASAFLGTGGATAGFLQALAPQFTGASLVILDSAPGGTDLWSGVGIPGLTNSLGCNLNSSSPSGHFCFNNFSLNAAGAVPSILTFVFDVTMPGGNKLETSSNINAIYNADSFGGGASLGQTSTDITIQQAGSTSVPEPGVLPLLSVGLIGLALLASRRSLA